MDGAGKHTDGPNAGTIAIDLADVGYRIPPGQWFGWFLGAVLFAAMMLVAAAAWDASL